LTHQAVAEAVGKSRAAVSNLLRLLELNADVKELLIAGHLEMGHARALLALKGHQQSVVAQQVMARELSVRETEALVRQQQTQPLSESPPPVKTEYVHAVQWQQILAEN